MLNSPKKNLKCKILKKKPARNNVVTEETPNLMKRTCSTRFFPDKFLEESPGLVALACIIKDYQLPTSVQIPGLIKVNILQ